MNYAEIASKLFALGLSVLPVAPYQDKPVTEIILNATNYRHTRKDGSYGNRTKRYSKRFASLVDAITFYETEIN